MQQNNVFESKANALGGLPVWGTVSGSAADRAGLREGDIVLRVNGVATCSLGNSLCPGPLGEIELQVLRNDVLVALSLPINIDSWVIDELAHQLLGRPSA